MTGLTHPLLLSLQVATCAVAIVMVLAVPLAFFLSRSGTSRLYRGIVESCIISPLVLPPTVVGYLLILVLGRHGWVGQYLDSWFGYSLMFHWHGAVLAAGVVCFPLVYLPARTAFAAVDRDLEDLARLQGAGTLSLFWQVSLPLAARGIAAGTVLAFARALGEFGATMMVMGNTARYQTLPLLIYSEHGTVDGERIAAMASTVLAAVSLVVVALYNRSCDTRRV